MKFVSPMWSYFRNEFKGKILSGKKTMPGERGEWQKSILFSTFFIDPFPISLNIFVKIYKIIRLGFTHLDVFIFPDTFFEKQ